MFILLHTIVLLYVAHSLAGPVAASPGAPRGAIATATVAINAGVTAPIQRLIKDRLIEATEAVATACSCPASPYYDHRRNHTKHYHYYPDACTDRQTDRQTGRQTDRQTDREGRRRKQSGIFRVNYLCVCLSRACLSRVKWSYFSAASLGHGSNLRKTDAAARIVAFPFLLPAAAARTQQDFLSGVGRLFLRRRCDAASHPAGEELGAAIEVAVARSEVDHASRCWRLRRREQNRT